MRMADGNKADIMDLLDSTITTIAAPTISSSLHGGPGRAVLISRFCRLGGRVGQH